jgi:hypothetical protein
MHPGTPVQPLLCTRHVHTKQVANISLSRPGSGSTPKASLWGSKTDHITTILLRMNMDFKGVKRWAQGHPDGDGARLAA